MQFRNIMTDLELYSEHWHERLQGRKGLDIFNKKKNGQQGKGIRSRRPAFAHQVIARDFLPSVLHWLTFEADTDRSDHMYAFIKFLHTSGKQLYRAVTSRACQMSINTISKLVIKHHQVRARLRERHETTVHAQAVQGPRVHPV